jgi:hypothetical protein
MTGKHWIIVLIILVSGYGIFSGIKGLRQSQKEKEKWTDVDKKVLVENCIRDSRDMAVKYPDYTQDYCDCSNDKILSRFTKAEYIDIIGKSIDEQKRILLPVFQDCLTEYQNRMKEAGH